jgi:hypothetical protein
VISKYLTSHPYASSNDDRYLMEHEVTSDCYLCGGWIPDFGSCTLSNGAIVCVDCYREHATPAEDRKDDSPAQRAALDLALLTIEDAADQIQHKIDDEMRRMMSVQPMSIPSGFVFDLEYLVRSDT